METSDVLSDIPTEAEDLDLNRPGDLEVPQCCFCWIFGDSFNEGELQSYIVKSNTYYVHENCLHYTGRKSNEDDAAVIRRTLFYGMKCKLEQCKKKRASIGCCEPSCRQIYHYRCAKIAGGEPCDDGKFYCSNHLDAAIEEKKQKFTGPKT